MDFLIWKRESWSLNGFSELSLIAMYLLRHLLEAQFFPRLFMRRNVRWKSYIPYTFLTWWVFVFCLRTSVRVPDLNNWKKKANNFAFFHCMSGHTRRTKEAGKLQNFQDRFIVIEHGMSVLRVWIVESFEVMLRSHLFHILPILKFRQLPYKMN